MKKLVFILTMTLVNWTYGAIPDELLNISAKLHDGRTIQFKKDVQELYFWDSSLEAIKLVNDEVVVPTDIESFSFFKDALHEESEVMASLYLGGIGGGGGGK